MHRPRTIRNQTIRYHSAKWGVLFSLEERIRDCQENALTR